MIKLRDQFAYELSEIHKRNLTSPEPKCRLKAMRKLSTCGFGFGLLINVANGYLSRRRRFEEVSPSEERKGARGFFRRIDFLLSSVAEVEMHYSPDEQLYAMRRLAMQRTPIGIRYLCSLLSIVNSDLPNVRGLLKKRIKLVDNTFSSYGLDNIVDCPEKYHLAETFEIAGLSRRFSFLSFSVD